MLMFRWWGPWPTLNMSDSCMPSCYHVLAVLMRHALTHTKTCIHPYIRADIHAHARSYMNTYCMHV